MSVQRRVLNLAIALVLASQCGVAGCGLMPSEPDPSAFVLEVAHALATQDFETYEALSVNNVAMVAGAQEVLPTAGIAAHLVDADRERIRNGYDRIVRSGRLRSVDANSYQATMVASEVDRWVLRIEHADGTPTGVEVQVRRWHDSYRILTVFQRD